MTIEEMDLILKGKEMSKETWIKNVLRIYSSKSREEAEALWKKLFGIESKDSQQETI